MSNCVTNLYNYNLISQVMDAILNFEQCSGDDYYCLLGCDESSTIEQIVTEYKTLSLQCHPDKNPEDPNAVTRFQKIQKAKEYLTDPEKRLLYDKWRRCGFSIPFEKFINLNKAAHTSMHWACKKQKDLMLENPCSVNELNHCVQDCDASRTDGPCKNAAWERDPANDVLRKFRNYEI